MSRHAQHREVIDDAKRRLEEATQLALSNGLTGDAWLAAVAPYANLWRYIREQLVPGEREARQRYAAKMHGEVA